MSSSLFSQFNYDNAWKEHNKLMEEEGLPESAMKTVESIYLQAKKDKNELQKTRAIFKKSELWLALEEKPQSKILRLYEEEIKAASAPYKQILHAQLASYYSAYFNSNRYLISNRTNINSASYDMETMTSQAFVDSIEHHYQAALAQPSILNSHLSSDFKDLLIPGYNDEGIAARPTLFTVIAFQYLDFFSQGELRNVIPSTTYVPDNIALLSPKDVFVKHEIKSPDPQSTNYKKLLIYQQLLKEKLTPQSALLVDLDRLLFANSIYAGADGEALYLATLEKAYEANKNSEDAIEVVHRIVTVLAYKEEVESKRKALKWCDDIIEKWPNAKAIAKLKQIKASLIQPTIGLIGKEVYTSHQKPYIQVNFSNIQSVTYEVYSISKEDFQTIYPYESENSLDNFTSGKQSIAKGQFKLSGGELIPSDTVLHLEKLPIGTYILKVHNPIAGASYGKILVSDLSILYNQSTNSLYVYNRQTGKPIKGAKVKLFTKNYDYNTRSYTKNLISTHTSNKNGKINPNRNENALIAEVSYKGDFYTSENVIYNAYQDNPSYTNISHEIYTDRSIYRPGQTVYYKILALSYKDQEAPVLLTKHKIGVQLMDANYQQVGAHSLVTDAYGSAWSSFTLPIGGLTGSFTIATTNSSRNIQVEEYKRPTFEVVVDSLRDDISLGDLVNVKGKLKAYAGNNLNNSDVRYTVYRELRYPRWCYYYPYNPQRQMVAAGSVKTDENGSYSIPFQSNKENTGQVRGIGYVYTVDILATDVSGETQSKMHTIALLDTDFSLVVDTKSIYDLPEPVKVTSKAVRFDGTSTTASGILTVYKAVSKPQYFDANYNRWSATSPKFEKGEKVYELPFTTDNEVLLKGLGVDNYILVFTAKDSKGNSIHEEATITVTHQDKCAYPDDKLLYVSSNQASYQPNEKMVISFGTAHGKLPVYYVLSRSNTVLKEGWITVNKNENLSYTVTEADRGNLTLAYFAGKNGKMISESMNIDVPWTNKQLNIEIASFRDKTTPGAKESWTIKVTPAQGDIRPAQLTMALYDASLDALMPHNWAYNFYPIRGGMGFTVFGYGDIYGFTQAKYIEADYIVEYPQYPYLLTFNVNTSFSPQYAEMDNSSSPRRMQKSAPAFVESADGAPVAQSNGAAGDASSVNTKQAAALSPRTNLNETVFFIPDLVTNAQGEVAYSFTINEALTQWKLLMLAHTKELAVGYTTKTITTTKDLIIIANMPRFVKSADSIWVTARIANTTSNALPYEAALALNDPISGKALIINNTDQASGIIGAGETKGVAWLIHVPTDMTTGSLSYNVSVTNGDKSDAEGGVIPVMSNLTPVINSYVVHLTKDRTETVTIANIDDPKVFHKALTIEYTAQPLWHVIKTLPHLKGDGLLTTSLANQLFAHSLAQDIISKHPQIQQTFDLWLKTQDKTAFKSQLQLNEELKYMVLNETPWVMDAINESQQFSNVALFFNTNNTLQEIQSIQNKLWQRQQSDGGFIWLDSGNSNPWVTKFVLQELGKLKRLGIDITKDKKITAALAYMDRQLVFNYNEMVKYNKNLDEYVPDSDIIDYLFTRSFFDQVPKYPESATVYAYYHKQACKYWIKQNIYTQSQLGTYLYRAKDGLYKDIAKSLVEKSFYDKNKGRYYNIGSGYHWYESSVERHCAIMDFLDEVGTTPVTIDEMRVWLLTNKRVNAWPTTKGTAAAVYSLLHKGSKSDLTPFDPTKHKIIAGTNDVYTAQQLGTGYFKKTYIVPEKLPGIITFENKGTEVSWGSVYHQYAAPASAIKANTNGPLTIQKKLFKKGNTANSSSMTEIKNGEILHVGDILVSRIIISTDRNMQFIDIKDMRGAGIEPYESISGYQYGGGLGYYSSVRDLSHNYFIEYLQKGTYVLEVLQKVVHKGTYDAGVATIQSSYAPDFSSNSEGFMIHVEK